MKDTKENLNKNLKILAKSSLVVLTGILFAKLFTYIYEIIIARYFGPETYGIFILSTMIVGWLISFSALGLNQGLLRYVSRFRTKNKKEDIRTIFNFSFKINLFISFTSALILFIFSDLIAKNIFHEPSLAVYLRFFALIIPLTVLMEVLLAIVLAYEEIGWYSFIHKFLTGFLKVSLIILFILIGLKTYAILFSYIISFFGALILTIFLCKKKFSYIFEKNKKHIKLKQKKLISELLSYSWPLLFSSILWKIFHWTDSFLIGYFKTANDVGIYNAAVPLAFLLTIVSSLFMQLFFPMINREYALGNKETVNQLTKQVGKWMLYVNLPVIILLFFFPEAILNIFFGPQYLDASNALRFLGIGTFFFSFFEASNQLITMRGKSKVILIDTVIAFVLNIILNLMLIPKYGINGAAIATMISLIVLSLLFAIQSMIYFSIVPLRRKMIILFISAAISSLILLFLRQYIKINFLSLFLLTFTFFTSYILFILLFRGLDQNDFSILKAVLNKFRNK